MVVTGTFGTSRFAHRSQRSGCPNDDAWLEVDVLASGVLPPDQVLEEAGK